MVTSAQQDLSVFQRAAWGCLLTVITALSTLQVGCATPFPALAAFAVLSLPRRDAYVLIGVNWLANQIIGFAWLNYPFTGECYRGGIDLLIATLGCAAIALRTQQLLRHAGGVLIATAAFAAAFVTYETLLYALTPWRTDGDFALPIILAILYANMIAFAVLFAFQRVAAKLGLARWHEVRSPPLASR